MRCAVLLGAFLLTMPTFAHAQSAAPAMSSTEMRELLDAAKETAKATRENVDYNRVVPDILFQILAKLDKLENKLDKIENELKVTKKR